VNRKLLDTRVALESPAPDGRGPLVARESSMDAFKVFAHWDEEAGVWWAESDDIQGLAAESETIEGLLDELKHVVPDLLQLNHNLISSSFEIHLVADRVEGMQIPA